MNIEELEEALGDILPPGFQIEMDKHGQLIIYTGLTQDEDGEILDFESDEDEDPEFDSDVEPLDEEDDEDEE